jgi:hypothetical protein
MVLAILAACAWPLGAEAQAAPVTLCVVHGRPVPGLEPDALRAGLRIEVRKAGAAIAMMDAASVLACEDAPQPRAVLLVGITEDVRFMDPSGRVRVLDVAAVEPIDRAALVGRAVLGLLGAGAPEPAIPILEPGSLAALAKPVVGSLGQTPSPAIAEPAGARAYVTAGGRWSWQPRAGAHAGGVELEAGVTLFDERLSFGVLGSFEPARDVPGSQAGGRILSGEALLMVRGAQRAGPLLVRFGLGGGIEWRRLEAGTDPGREVRTSTPASIAGEVEVVVPAGDLVRVSAAFLVRGYPGGTSYTWASLQAYEAPAATIGLALRVGVVP